MKVQQAKSNTLYGNPAYYSLLFGAREHDLGFYADLAAEVAGSVLELGVGTGRVAIPLARTGHDIMGIDPSSEMLGELATRVSREPEDVQRRIRWQQGDSRTIDLKKLHDLVICPFNGLAHLHDQKDFAAFFGNVKAHLAPGGTFAFDTLLPDPNLLRQQGEGSFVPWFRDPRDGEVSRCEETIAYDALTQILTITTTIRSMETDRDPETLTLRLRQLFPQETMLLLRHHGFRILRRELGLGDVIGYVCAADDSS